MHGSELSFVPLLVVIALSFIVPLALSPVRRIGIPVVVGEIIAGIIVGKSGFDIVQQDFVLEVLSVFGFAYLMFLSGLEIDFSAVPANRHGLRASHRRERLLRNPFLLGAAMFLLTALCSMVAGFFLQWLGVASQPFIMAMILSTTSLGVVAPVLKERGLAGSNQYGQTILIAAMIADFVTILLISGYVLMRGQGLTVDLLLILVLLLAFLATYRAAAHFRDNLPARRLMQALSTATSQIRVRGSMALALIFIALAESLGIEAIIGAFLAGVIVSLLSGQESSVLREKLDAIGYGFLIPIFFVMVGVKFDLPALLESNSPWVMVALLTLIAFAVKFAGGLVLRVAFSWRETLAASALLSARLSLIIAVAVIGVQLGVISPALDAAIILVAIITCVVSPILFGRLSPPRYRASDHTLLIGSTHDAEPLARRLRRIGQSVNITNMPNADSDGEPASRHQLSEQMRDANIARTRTLIAMAESDDDNLQVCRIAREVYSVPRIVAWVRDPSRNQRFIDAGAAVVNPSSSKLLILESMALGARGLGQVPEDDPDQEIRVIKLQNGWFSGRTLKQLGLPDSVSVLRLERRDAVLEPEPATVAQTNDSFTISGPKEQVYSVARRFAKRW